MSGKVAIQKTTLEAIGAAVRNKEGTTDLIPVNTLADRIAALPSGVNKIGQYADGTMTELTAEDLKGATKIRQYAFAFAPFTSVDIPSTITEIDSKGLYKLESLQRINIPNIEFWLNINFQDYESVPNHYSHNLFVNNEPLVHLVVPYPFKQIYGHSFRNIESLESVEFASSLTQLNTCAFYGCINLKTITSRARRAPTIFNKNTFNNCPIEKIIVPAGCGDAYRNATNWANFADYIEEAVE